MEVSLYPALTESKTSTLGFSVKKREEFAVSELSVNARMVQLTISAKAVLMEVSHYPALTDSKTSTLGFGVKKREEFAVSELSVNARLVQLTISARAALMEVSLYEKAVTCSIMANDSFFVL